MTELTAKPHFRQVDGQWVVEYKVGNVKAATELYPVTSQSSFLSLIQESYPGAWQHNVLERSPQNVLAFSAVYACISLISGDVSKLRILLTENQNDGTWREVVDSAPFLGVLRKPNPYQTRVQFVENWLVSKLIHGNAYALKERDNRGGEGKGIVTALYMLDPCNVTPLVAENGDVYYRLKGDSLAGVSQNGVTVPASEIIHDRMLCFWHPLIGISPIYACGMSAMQGVAIQGNASKFFENMSRPSGVLTAPGKISDETAIRLKQLWESNFKGGNIGRLAVMGDGLEYKPMTIPPIEAQLIEQLNFTVGDVGRTFHVPPYKLGLASGVTFTNAAQANQDYYSQCLQTLIESFENAMDEGLELPAKYRTEFDLDGLQRMDPLAQAETDSKSIGASVMAPNEARRKRNLPPVDGGDSPMAQQQNYSLPALAKRDAQEDPFKSASPAPPPAIPAKDLAAEITSIVKEAIGTEVEALRLKEDRARLEREEAAAAARAAQEATEKAERDRIEAETRSAEQARLETMRKAVADREEALREAETRQAAERDRLVAEAREQTEAEAEAFTAALVRRLSAETIEFA